MSGTEDNLKKIEARIDSALDVVLKRATTEVVVTAAHGGITFSEHELELVEIGTAAGSAMTLEYLHERGWLNAARMTRDLLAGS